MRTPASNEFKSYYDNFLKEVSIISMYHRDAKAIFTKELNELNQWETHGKNHPKSNKVGESLNNFSFHDLKSGELRFYSQSKRSAKDRITTSVLLRNKQYQWLLTDVYELYEDFLESCYAYIGWKNMETWTLGQFGNIKIGELKNQPYDWFLKIANKRSASSIIKELRRIYPKIEKSENPNKKTNITLVMCLIEKMRHIIVHQGGKTTNKNEFIDSVLNANGTPSNGNRETHNYKFIDNFFGHRKYANTLILLEVPTDDIPALNTHIDIFAMFVDKLIGYATLIFEEIDSNEVRKNKRIKHNKNVQT